MHRRKTYLPLPNEVRTCVTQLKKLRGFCVPSNCQLDRTVLNLQGVFSFVENGKIVYLH